MLGKHCDLPLEAIARDAGGILSEARITRWSRALALRLDRRPDDARDVLGVLLNHGLPEGYGMQLRNKSGPLGDCVCRAVLHTEKLVGKVPREALGWLSA
jgi:hypothetical protein